MLVSAIAAERIAVAPEDQEAYDTSAYYKGKLIWEARKRFVQLELLFRRKSLLLFLKSSIRHVSIETTNICNANCIFCAFQYQKRPTGVMSIELFRKIIDFLGAHDFSDFTIAHAGAVTLMHQS